MTRGKVWGLKEAYAAVIRNASGYHVSGEAVVMAVNRNLKNAPGVYQRWLAAVKDFSRGWKRADRSRSRIAEFLLQTKIFATVAIQRDPVALLWSQQQAMIEMQSSML